MALIKCRECGKEISDQAVACPSCGVPIQAVQPVRIAPERKTGCGTLIVVLIVLLIVLGILGGSDEPAAPAEVPQPVVAAQIPTSGAGWKQTGVQGVFHLVAVDQDAATNEDIYRSAIVDLCQGQPICQVKFWVGEEAAAKTMPLSDRELAHMAASWSSNSNTGHRMLLWNCKLLPQSPPADCL